MSNEIIKRYQVQTLSAQIHRQFGGVTTEELGPSKVIDVPKERQCRCLRHRNGRSAAVDMFKMPNQKKAYFKGLQTCGSVFSCPICAVKITKHRKEEIETLIKKTEGYHHYLVTLTIPHYHHQSCAEVREMFMGARRRLKRWDTVKHHAEFIPYKKYIKHHQYDGSVTTVDVTYGDNGWHIHSHELVTLKEKADLREFRDITFQNWTKSVLYSGIDIKNANAFYRRSVQIDELQGDHLNRMTSYLSKIDATKWGASAELSLGYLKKADNRNLTPFGMLHHINDQETSDERRFAYQKYAPIFWEYCKTFKGSHYIAFSKGLKAKYGMQDLTDKQIVDAENLFDDFYGFWEDYEWQQIKKHRLRGFVVQNSEGTFEELTEKLRLQMQVLQNEKKTKRQRVFKAA